MTQSGLLFKIRLTSGRILGPLDLVRIQKLVIKKHIVGDEMARHYPEGDWQPVSAIAEIAEILMAHAEGRLESLSSASVNFEGATQILPTGEDAVSDVSLPSLPSLVSWAKVPSLGEKDDLIGAPAPTENDGDATQVFIPTVVSTTSPSHSLPKLSEQSLVESTGDKTMVGGALSVSEGRPPNEQSGFLDHTGDVSLLSPGVSSNIANESTVVFQRSGLAVNQPTGRAQKKAKIIKGAAVAVALLLVASELFLPEKSADKSGAQLSPVRPTLPELANPKPDPQQSAKLYDAAMTAYVLDTVAGYRRASSLLSKATGQDSSNVKALAMLASSYLNLIDSSNKDENYFTVISKLIELSRAKDVDLAEAMIAEVEYLVVANKAQAAQARLAQYIKTHPNANRIDIYYYVAEALFARGDAQGAARYLGTIPDAKAFSPKVLFLRGRVAEKLKDPTSAVAEYEKAIRMNPDHATSMLAIARLYNEQGKLSEAEKYLKFMVTHQSLLPPRELGEAYYLNSLFLQGKNDFDLALGSVERAIRLDPERADYNLQYYLLRAKAGEAIPKIRKEARMYYFLGEGEKLAKQGKYQEAQVQFLEARQAKPDSVLPLVKLGDVFSTVGDQISARVNYKKAAEKAPKDGQIWSKYMKSLIENYEWQEADQAMAQFQQTEISKGVIEKAIGDRYAKQGNFSTAQTHYRNAMSQGSIPAGVYLAYAKSLMETKNFKDAPFFFALALRFDPTNIEAISGTAKCVAETDGVDRGIALLEDELQNLDGFRADLLTAIAELQIKKGQWPLAQRYLDQAIEANPAFAHVWRVQAQVHRNSENVDPKALDRAAEAYKSYSDRNPTDPSGYVERYQIFLQKAMFEQADQELGRVYTLYPRYPKLHFYKGRLYSRMGNTKAALEEFKQELQNNPNAVNTLLALGNELIRDGNATQALTYLNQAMRAAPRDPAPKSEAGRANYIQKNYQAAAALLMEAIKLDSGNPAHYRLIGYVYRDMGDAGNARWAFRKYLEMEPDAPDKAEFQRFL